VYQKVQILLESPEFCRRYYKIILVSYSGHWTFHPSLPYFFTGSNISKFNLILAFEAL